MTVTYTAKVATCPALGSFPQLLWRWKGSIYKLVWLDLLIFLLLYYAINFTYRFILEDNTKLIFDIIVYNCNKYGSLIPLSFVLGFYVSLVMVRWWNQYITIPWPDPIAVFVSSYVHGNDEAARLMRRTVMRYVCLCHVMVLTMIAPRVKKRFPTYNHLMEAGFLQESEKVIIECLDELFPLYPKHWMPIVWASSIITRARKEGKIRYDYAMKTIIDELNKFRGMCGFLLYYDWVSVPLVYTQVVTLAVYMFFLCKVISTQWTSATTSVNYDNFIDFYFPFFTSLQFFFYMGWLKVAESLINPFGEDDDDFELNWMIDRNLTISYLIVDEMHQEHPELVRDQYWDEIIPSELPFTMVPGSSTTKLNVNMPSTAISETSIRHKMKDFKAKARISKIQKHKITLTELTDKEILEEEDILQEELTVTHSFSYEGIEEKSSHIKDMLQKIEIYHLNKETQTNELSLDRIPNSSDDVKSSRAIDAIEPKSTIHTELPSIEIESNQIMQTTDVQLKNETSYLRFSTSGEYITHSFSYEGIEEKSSHIKDMLQKIEIYHLNKETQTNELSLDRIPNSSDNVKSSRAIDAIEPKSTIHTELPSIEIESNQIMQTTDVQLKNETSYLRFSTSENLFEQLVAQRKKERNERIRNRFLNAGNTLYRRPETDPVTRTNEGQANEESYKNTESSSQ